MAIDFVSFPIKHGDFPYFLYVYQRVYLQMTVNLKEHHPKLL